MKRPELRDELRARAAADWAAAEALFAAVEADALLTAELDALLENAATPLLAVLPGWSRCPPAGGRLIEATADNADRLASVVEEGGWPGLDTVAADGADAAWLIAQHADLRNELRRGWIEPLERAVHAGQADPRHLACLVDRVASVDGSPQVYATVAVLEDGAVSFLHPVADPPTLDARRASIGLPPVADEVPLLELGEIVPFGPDRHDHPLMRWPADP